MEESKDKAVNQADLSDKAEKVKKLANRNKAAALGLAVCLTLSSALTGCVYDEYDDDDEDEYYSFDVDYYGGGYHGGSYYYVKGGSYKSGSWGKSSSGYSGSSTSKYSFSKGGGSVGG
ncbi:MAG: hypothetical protein N3B21_01020 [Clostridia bacterium]|nr:hypothetical protein [Clostridia bacterium]